MRIRTRAGAALPRALRCPRRGLTRRRPATGVEPLCRHFSTPSRLFAGQPRLSAKAATPDRGIRRIAEAAPCPYACGQGCRPEETNAQEAKLCSKWDARLVTVERDGQQRRRRGGVSDGNFTERAREGIACSCGARSR